MSSGATTATTATDPKGMTLAEMREKGLSLGKDVVGCVQCHFEHTERYLWPKDQVKIQGHVYLCPNHQRTKA